LFQVLALVLAAFIMSSLWSCMETGEPIDRPDEYTHVLEAKEKYILRAAARVLEERDLGKATIHADRNEVTSDYVVRGDWRTRSHARIRRIDWKRCALTLSVVTERKTATGWEMRRLLGKDQYDKIFYVIENRVYQEMAEGD